MAESVLAESAVQWLQSIDLDPRPCGVDNSPVAAHGVAVAPQGALAGTKGGTRAALGESEATAAWTRTIIIRTSRRPPAMSTPQAQVALRLLTLITRKLTDDFSGLGIVIYDSLRALPFLPLEVGGDEMFNLPVSGLDAVGEVLAHTAKRSTHWHDGFHLLQADPLRLTHLCQFISPPLPKAGDSVPRASGARHMTALLASRVAGIVAVAILTQERVASIYEAGTRTKSEPLT
jgi:hypothetical protein